MIANSTLLVSMLLQHGGSNWFDRVGLLGWAGLILMVIASILVPLGNYVGAIGPATAALLWSAAMGVFSVLWIIDLGYEAAVLGTLHGLILLIGFLSLLAALSYLRFRYDHGRRVGHRE